MKVKELSFGTINIDGKDYSKDIVIHKGKIEKRKKKEQWAFKSGMLGVKVDLRHLNLCFLPVQLVLLFKLVEELI